MSEYVMNHTGEQLDEAIDKVLNGYIKPEGTINITEKDNNTEVDVTKYALAKVQIPIPTFTTEEIVINPTESTITKQPIVDGFSKVTVNPISSTYIGSKVTRKSEETFIPKKDEQQVIPSGRYLTGNQIIDKIPDEYINKSLLQNAIHYFDLSSNKTGNSTVSSSWYSFTPAFKPKIILFSQAEYNNGSITRISSSINTIIGSVWIDPSILPYTRYYMKGWFLTTSSTPTVNMSSNGNGAQYDAATNKIFMFSKGSSSYGLKAGTNSHSAVSGYYMIQYWG